MQRPWRCENQKYTWPIGKQPESHPDFHRIPSAIRGARSANHAAIRAAGGDVPGAGMDRYQRLRLYGPAHASLVRRATWKADVQSLLCGVVVGGGDGVVDGAQGLIPSSDERF